MSVDFGRHTVSDPDLQSALQTLSDQTGRTVRVTSGDRDAVENAAANGADRSAHLTGKAADITIDGLSAREASEAAARSDLFDGVGHYDGSARHGEHTHVEIGRRRADGSGRRWAEGKDGRISGWHSQSNIIVPRVGDS
jgi:uncharacterized protein YcbK (DUF882 family)